MNLCTILSVIAFVLAGCGSNLPAASQASGQTAAEATGKAQPSTDEAPQPQRLSEAEIEAIVDELVFAKGDAQNRPVISPGITDKSEEYRKRFTACQSAFRRLSELKDDAFPVLVKHLDDKRQSINFRNHSLGNSVGHACYWNIYYQLQDRPRGYSRYGYSRKGRDGKNHPKPYWDGSPFDEAGGLQKWLTANKDLNYQEKQIKCLSWLLQKEKQIGATDAESYFINILPLEIRILERRLENGDDVQAELERLRNVLKNKRVDQVPQELLPASTQRELDR